MGVASRVQFSDDGSQIIGGSNDHTVPSLPCATPALSRCLPRKLTLAALGVPAGMGTRPAPPNVGSNSRWCTSVFGMLGLLTSWFWKVTFWDIASGEEVRQVAGSKFPFEPTQKTSPHFLTASGDTLLITERLSHEGLAGMEDGATPAACFKAPQPIASVRCHEGTICVVCTGGAVCILQAP